MDLDLARKLELASAWRSIRFSQAYARLHPDNDSAVLEVGGGFAVFTAADFPVNHATGLGLYGPVQACDLDRVEGFFRGHGAAPAIQVCPLAHPSLVEQTARRGYRLEGFYSVLLRPVDDADQFIRTNPAVRVTQAAPDQAALLVRTVAQGFSGLDEPPQGDLAVLETNFSGEDTFGFLAWLDGQPAGGGLMAVHGDTAEFGGASTRPAFRRRGVQTALLAARLEACRRLGLSLAMVLTEPGSASQKSVEQAGFHLAYTKARLVLRE